jgi:glycosyltransferase involved in cell wall biosynthesis
MRILLVSPQSPFGEASGSRQRTRLYYDTLSQLAPTDVLVIAHEGPNATESADPANVYRITSARGPAGWNPYAPDTELTRRIEAMLPQPLERYRLVAGRYLWSLCQLALPKGVPTLVDLDDFRYRFGHRPWRQPRLLPQIARRRLKEWIAHRQLQRFDGLVFVNPHDHADAAIARSIICPNVAPQAPGTAPAPALTEPPGLLFVGSMWYGPNRDGIEWFLQSVWPQVRRTVPSARLAIVGAAPPRQRALWQQHEGVSAPGFVDDLGAAYAACTAAIIPVWYGGGSNIKLLEALAYGKPCIASTFTHQPFRDDLHDGEHLLVAQDADAFVSRCVALLTESQATTMGAAGRHAVQRAYTPEVFSARLRALVQQLAPALFDGSAGEVSA